MNDWMLLSGIIITGEDMQAADTNDHTCCYSVYYIKVRLQNRMNATSGKERACLSTQVL